MELIECLNPIYVRKQHKSFPCGKCAYCRSVWLNDWATRLQMQKELSQYTICCTLTYNSENLPHSENGVPTLSKDDIQKFFKRVRKELSKSYADCSIQYFISGEYGSSFLRPHYHLILFVNTENIGYTQYDFQTVLLNKWRKGFIQFMPNNNLSLGYLAKYIGKTTGISEYAETNNIPLPFVLMSRNPAIGSKYLEKGNNFEYHFSSLENSHILLPGMGNKIIPKYIRRVVYQHYPKVCKEKYYNELRIKKLEENEIKLEKRRKYYSDCNTGSDVYCRTREKLEKQREYNDTIKQQARVNEDLNYLKRKLK